ncbi:MAG: DNA pilot protein [Microvirus sp.]|nr:MAG: DNA pilot protein [Microvirus sp.]
MWPAIGAAAGGITGGVMDMFGQESANEANRELQASSQAWQEKMRASQYQTAVQDLKSAGLNPMLAYTQGGSGNLSTSNPIMQSVTGGLATTARDIPKMVAEVANLKASNEKIKADTHSAEATAELTKALAANAKADNAGKTVDARFDKTTIGGVAREIGRYGPSVATAIDKGIKTVGDVILPERKWIADALKFV